jgi:hypothetical protein
VAQNGFIPLRRGILEHLEQGRLSGNEFLAYVLMILRADSKTGIWFGGALALSAFSGGFLSGRTARRVLEGLETKGYIKRFSEPGRRGNYPVLINFYEVTQGARSGHRLNAEQTTDWRHPVYEGGASKRRGDDLLSTIDKDNNKKTLGAEQAPLIPERLIFDGHHLKISERQDGILAAAFPGVDRQAEYRKMDSWLEANPQRRTKKRKTTGHWWFQRIGVRAERTEQIEQSQDGDDWPKIQKPWEM